MDDGMDGWMEKASRKTTTTSFTKCNCMSPFIQTIKGQNIYTSKVIDLGTALEVV
jgi:hypothetical protein